MNDWVSIKALTTKENCSNCKFKESCFDGICDETWWCYKLNDAMSVLGLAIPFDKETKSYRVRFSIKDPNFVCRFHERKTDGI